MKVSALLSVICIMSVWAHESSAELATSAWARTPISSELPASTGQHSRSRAGMIECFSGTWTNAFKVRGQTYFDKDGKAASVSLLAPDKHFYTMGSDGIYKSLAVLDKNWASNRGGYPYVNGLEELGRTNDERGLYLVRQRNGTPIPSWMPVASIDIGGGSNGANPETFPHTVIKKEDLSTDPEVAAHAEELFEQEIQQRFANLPSYLTDRLFAKHAYYTRRNSPQPENGWRWTPDTPFLEERDVTELREGFCSCTKHGIAIDAIDAAKQKIINRSNIQLQDSSGEARMLRTEDLMCEALTS